MDAKRRVVTELRAQGLDAIVVASPDNTYYLSEIRLTDSVIGHGHEAAPADDLVGDWLRDALDPRLRGQV